MFLKQSLQLIENLVGKFENKINNKTINNFEPHSSHPSLRSGKGKGMR